MGCESALRLDAEEIVARLREAGLRQKDGAGRPLAPRWHEVCEHKGAGKVVICNALDGDPRVPTARFVIDRDPQTVVDGLLVAARATGATNAVICVNVDYVEEIAALERAIEGLPDVRIKEMTASLVAVEETALIKALEGRQPLPFLRAEGDVRGVGGASTLVESAATLASVGTFFAGGSVGPETIVLTVLGDVGEPRTLEAPVGTTVGAAIEQAAGRPLAELDVKAVQIGGPAGRFLAGGALDTPVAHDDLQRAGTTVGSGGIEVFRGPRCAIEMARGVTARLHEQSCGKCVFCREGTRQLLDMLDDLVEGRAGEETMELLPELAQAMKTGSICSIGWGAALPVLSALELFAVDFESHLEKKGCPAVGAGQMADAGAGA